MTALRRLCRFLHRELGFFFAGVTLLYAISGLAVNHVRDWDPSFEITRQDVTMQLPDHRADVSSDAVLAVLESLGLTDRFQTYDFPTPHRIKIYLEDGSLAGKLEDTMGVLETIERRPVLYQLNFLHLNPAGWWKIFADVFAVALVILVISGLFLTPGRKGLTGRGGWLLAAGVVVPMLAMVFVA
jgi:uncharacterized protein